MGNCCPSCWPWKKADPNQNDNVDVEVVERKRPRAVPSTAQYVSKSGRTVVEMLKAAAPLVPVPLVGQVLDVVLALINICDQATALQGQIDDLKDQLCSLGVILVDSAEREALSIATATRITKLRDDLDRIKTDLQEILDQGSAFLGFFADTNKGSVDDCVKRLNIALTEFHLSHAITTEQDLHRMLQRLEDISSQLQQANRGIDEISRDVKTLMKNHQLHSAPIFSSGMPAKLRNFRGHEAMIADIGNLLCNDGTAKPRIAILATGGMGKTTMAVEVMESDTVKRSYENRFWVSCKEAKSFDIFLRVLAKELRVKANSGDILADVRGELLGSNAPRLVVLDNFETPWEASESDVERVLCLLASIPHVSIVITMRSNFPPSKQNIDWHVKELKPLDLNASRQIYTDINPAAAGHHALDDLLNGLGCMPYAIKLIATLGETSLSAPDELLERWKESGTGILDNEIERSIRLSVDSTYMQSNPESLSLLVTLSMLPAGTKKDHLDMWAVMLPSKSKIPLAISILNKTALISLSGELSNPIFFVYPVVQSYMEHSPWISEQDRTNLQKIAFQFILKHNSSPGDSKFKDDMKALASEDVNFQGILTFAARQRMKNDNQSDDLLDRQLLDALLTFSLYQLQSKPTLDMATLSVDVARYLHSNYHLAEGLDCLGRIRLHLSDYHGAGDALKEARILFKSLSNPLRSVQTTYQLMGSYNLSNYRSAANALEEEIQSDLTELVAGNERQSYAIALLSIAWNLIAQARHYEALQYLTISQKELNGLGHSYEAGEYLHQLSICYGALGQYEESMKIAQLSAKEFEYLGLDADRNYIRSLECTLHLYCENYDQALYVSETYLKESRRLGDIPSTACALEYIAQVFEQRGDIAAVRLGYESALEQYKIIGSAALAQEGMQRCEHNLSILAQAMSVVEDDQNDIISDGRRLMPRLEHLKVI